MNGKRWLASSINVIVDDNGITQRAYQSPGVDRVLMTAEFDQAVGDRGTLRPGPPRPPHRLQPSRAFPVTAAAAVEVSALSVCEKAIFRVKLPFFRAGTG